MAHSAAVHVPHQHLANPVCIGTKLGDYRCLPCSGMFSRSPSSLLSAGLLSANRNRVVSRPLEAV
jgi:hypothetical protein